MDKAWSQLSVGKRRPRKNEKRKEINCITFRCFGNLVVTWALFLISDLGKSSGPGDNIDSSHPLSKVSAGCNPSRSKKEINQEQREIV